MRTNTDLPDRKRNRIKSWDYSENGYYFVTICLDNMNINRFGDVKDGKMILSKAGKMIEKKLIEIPKFYKGTELDIFVVMPNHLHVILVINKYLGQTQGFVPTENNKSVGDDPRVVPNPINEWGQTWKSVPTDTIKRQLSISEIIQRYKTFTTNQYIKNVKLNNWPPFHNRLWQRSFYDHVVRYDESLEKIQTYILNNPFKWEYDRNNPNRKARRYHFEY